MKPQNLPIIDLRYWTAIIVASMAGANTGDFAARYLHLGHTGGLLPLALIFALVLWAERRAPRATEVYYWLAIIVLRTAATNLADLSTHDLQLGFGLTDLVLTVLLVAFVAIDDRRGAPSFLTSGDTKFKRPATDKLYWIAMLTAGTLGTATGDFVADELGLGVGYGSIVLLLVFVAILFAALHYGRMSTFWYWATIVAARTAGTTIGECLANRHGLNLGLPVSTVCTLGTLAAIVLVWPRNDAPAPATS